MIDLTDEQRQAVKEGEAIRIRTPEFGDELVVMSASQYDALRQSLDDVREQRTVLRYAMKQGAKAASENPY